MSATKKAFFDSDVLTDYKNKFGDTISEYNKNVKERSKHFPIMPYVIFLILFFVTVNILYYFLSGAGYSTFKWVYVIITLMIFIASFLALFYQQKYLAGGLFCLQFLLNMSIILVETCNYSTVYIMFLHIMNFMTIGAALYSSNSLEK